MYSVDFGNQSDAGTLGSETGETRAAFASWSAASFPLMPTWLGTQQKMISLVCLISLCNSRTLRTNGCSVQRSCMASRADFESENIMCLTSMHLLITFSANSKALTSAEKIEIILLYDLDTSWSPFTAAAATASSVLDPSVYIGLYPGWFSIISLNLLMYRINFCCIRFLCFGHFKIYFGWFKCPRRNIWDCFN